MISRHVGYKCPLLLVDSARILFPKLFDDIPLEPTKMEN